VTYTLFMRLGFILSAAAAQFVARRIGLSRPASVATGLIYGFSTSQIVEGAGHLFLVFAPLPPLILYAVYCLLIGRWGPVRAGLTAGGLAAVDFMISAETALVATLVLAVTLVVATAICWRRITSELIGRFVAAAACAVVAAGVLLAYPIKEMLGRDHVSGTAHSFIQSYHSFLAGFVFPDVFTWLDPFDMRTNIYNAGLHAASQWENGAYIGIPLLLVVIAAAIKGWRHRLVLVGAVATLVVLLMSVGEVLDIDGHKVILSLHHHHVTLRSPYSLLAHIPYVENIEPVRLMALAWLGIGLLAGYGLDRLIRWQRGRMSDGHQWRRRVVTVSSSTGQMHVHHWRSVVGSARGLVASVSWRLVATVVVAGVVVASLLPDRPYPMRSTNVASFFSSTEMDAVIPANSAVLFFPYPTLDNNHALMDQAIGKFHYQIIGGEGLVGNAVGTNVGIQPLYPPDLPSVFVRTEMGIKSGGLGNLPFTLPNLPPLDLVTIRQFHAFVLDNDVSTIVVEFATTPQAKGVIPYLKASFGLPLSYDAGSVLVWDKARLDAPYRPPVTHHTTKKHKTKTKAKKHS
jgi:hypothetical protein